jgi:hypothetical protein
MVSYADDVPTYTEIHVTYDVLISGKLTIFNNILARQVPDIATFILFPL